MTVLALPTVLFISICQLFYEIFYFVFLSYVQVWNIQADKERSNTNFMEERMSRLEGWDMKKRFLWLVGNCLSGATIGLGLGPH